MLFENDPHDGFRWFDMQIWYLTDDMLRDVYPVYACVFETFNHEVVR